MPLVRIVSHHSVERVITRTFSRIRTSYESPDTHSSIALLLVASTSSDLQEAESVDVLGAALFPSIDVTDTDDGTTTKEGDEFRHRFDLLQRILGYGVRVGGIVAKNEEEALNTLFVIRSLLRQGDEQLSARFLVGIVSLDDASSFLDRYSDTRACEWMHACSWSLYNRNTRELYPPQECDLSCISIPLSQLAYETYDVVVLCFEWDLLESSTHGEMSSKCALLEKELEAAQHRELVRMSPVLKSLRDSASMESSPRGSSNIESTLLSSPATRYVTSFRTLVLPLDSSISEVVSFADSEKLLDADSRYVSGISNVQIPVLVSKQQSDEEILSRCVLAVREELQRRQENYLYRCISGLDSEERSVESSLDLSLCSQSFSFLSETLPLPIVSDALFSVSREEIESVKDGNFSFLRNISSSSAIPPLPVSVRRSIHSLFAIPFDRPLFWNDLALDSFEQKQREELLCTKLQNVHVFVEPPRSQKGELFTTVSLVEGTYLYYHYTHDGENDKGWGCAYRSLQTLHSWCYLQGYTSNPPLSILGIQESLVKTKDKKPSFAGGKQWIGAIEVSIVLQAECDMDTQTVHFARGSVLGTSEATSILIRHFRTCGSPVMIGGGVLAHTILGIAVREQPQWEVRYLILDPHYVGVDSVSEVTAPFRRALDRNGTAPSGCFWVDPSSLFDNKSFYNLALIRRPLDCA